ncbi:beta-propeller fold lactonase family protein [Colwellia sp. BRX8-2]|uniref:beta-propeller fold lactonase family protein n=1 Tax=unclassified Colwellia TaxID=196834 RepID=UPI0015F393C5|nr:MULTISPECIES: beta-propeller fold lactonase family protein [unclassified Colwellia]MBA6352677.1 beta-propeller fold lactonase family protein [Colwellia sp. BRX9-1]MBA6361994.1 beta-propeller fold lactonase family protein [Colwellia sp. BRX8-6]MBA6369744.1 beta-propeller fold lactonase family protein [Colwellia sp. BRX8-5]MBA6377268.1 beta-propeller fold lactonase family protein [Colwellia sp. BRX8-2]
MDSFSLIGNKRLLLSASLSFLLISCGGGGSESKSDVTITPPAPIPTATHQDITVIDGYIRGAIAYIDLNNNKTLDDGEPWIETGPSGFGQIDTTSLGLPPEDIKVIVIVPPGAIDENTISDENPDGIPITEETAFQMLSLPGENIATPLTTLVSISAENNGDLKAAKTAVAESLGISIADLSTDYLETGSQELTVLSELMIKNQVIPKDLTNAVTAGELLVAKTVSSQISSIIQQANESGVLVQNTEAIGALANATASSVISFVEENAESLTTETSKNFSAVIELINETTYNSFEAIITSTEAVSAEVIAQTSQQASVMGDVIIDLMVDNINSADGITAEEIADATVIANVISEVIEAMIAEDLDGTLDINVLTEIAIITAETTLQQLTQLENSGLTDEEIAEALAVAAAETAANLEEAAEVGIELDDFDGDGIANDIDTDIDGDGVLNDNDAFDYDATESIDTDLDGLGNNSDPDIDGDSYLNINDAFVLDATEWVDSDNDNVGNNADTDDNGDGHNDTAYKTIAQENDGLIEWAQDFVVSPDSKFMYIGSENGLLIVTLDENGKATDRTELVTPSDLGSRWRTSSFYIDFSPNGKLYWGTQVEINYVQANVMMVFDVNEETGSVVKAQTISFEQSSGIAANQPEIFKFSSDGQFLYTTMHYGDAGNELLIYKIDADTGHLSYVSNYDLDTFGNPDYEHNFDISFDNKYLYYGYTNYDTSPSSAALAVMMLDTDKGFVIDSWVQEFDIESTGLSFVTSKTSDRAFMTAGGDFMVLDVEANGGFSVESSIAYDSTKPASMALSINEAENSAIVFSSDYDTSLNRVDHITIDESFIPELQYSKVGLKEFSLSISFSGDGNQANWLGYYNDILYTLNLADETINETLFGAKYLGGLQSTVLTENSTLSLDRQANSVKITDSGSDQGLVTNHYDKPDLIGTLRSRVALDVSTLLFITNDYDTGNSRTTYVTATIPEEGTSLLTPITRYLGNGEELYRIYTGVKVPRKNQLLAYERSVNTSQTIGYSLYNIESDNSLTFVSAFVADDGYVSNFNSLVFDGDNFYVDGQSFSLTNDEITSIGTLPNDLHKFVYAKDKTFVYSLVEEQLISYAINADTGELTQMAIEEMPGTWRMTKVSEQNFLITSLNKNQNITLKSVQVNDDGSLTHVSTSSVTTESNTEFLVNTYPVENSDVVWLFVQGGYYDVIKVEIASDSDSDGDGVFDNADLFDLDATETTDLDKDGVGDNSDTDIDGDGIINDEDAFPLNRFEWLDTDEDGLGNNSDYDIDGDGYLNQDDAFPLDSTEWIDSDDDGTGDNADTDDNGDGVVDSAITVMAQDKDGLIDNAQDFVFSADGRFMYVGGTNGLLIITMGDDGQVTETSQLVTPSELGLVKVSNSTYLEFSPDGNLYWALNAKKDDTDGGALMVLNVDSTEGTVTNSQFSYLSEITDLSLNLVEMFKISSDGRFLYATAHYGTSDDNLLVYGINADTGHLTYISASPLDQYPDYEHNFDISSDDQYLYYGYSSGIAKVQTLTLDQNTGEVSSSTTQEFPDYNSNGMSLLTSKTSNKAYIAADEYFMTLDIASDGSLTVDDTINYNIPGSIVMAMDINAEGNKVVINSQNSGNHKIDYLTISDSAITHHFGNSNLDDMTLDIHLNNDGNRVTWIGWYNDIVNNIDLIEEETINQHKFGAKGFDNLASFAVNNDSVVAMNNRGNVTSIEDLGNGLGLATNIFHNLQLSSESIRSSLLFNDNKVMFFADDFSVEQRRTQYTVAEIPTAGSELINVETYYLGDGSERYSVYKSILLSNNRILTFERSLNTLPNGESFDSALYAESFGLALYLIEDDNTLTLLSAISTDVSQFGQWDLIKVNGSDIHLAGSTYSYNSDVLSVKESAFPSLTQFVFSADNFYVYSIEAADDTTDVTNDKIVTYAHDMDTGALVEIAAESLVGHWDISLLNNQQILLVSKNIDKAISVNLMDITIGDSITSVATAKITTSTDIESKVNVRSFENTVWLFGANGYYDVIKLRID